MRYKAFMRRASLVGLATLFLASRASAQPAGLPPLPPPLPPASPSPLPLASGPSPSSPSASATPATVPRSPQRPPPGGCYSMSQEHCHDGAYLRFGFGFGYASIWGSGPQGNASIAGNGVALTLALGGTPIPGLVFAGVIHGVVGDGTFAGGPPGATGTASAGVVQLGLLADWYPVPEGGWHVGGIVGFGGVSVTDSSGADSSSATLGASILGGYDWWIGPQWSLGVMMALSTATSESMRDSNRIDTGYSFVPIGVAIEGSLLWH